MKFLAFAAAAVAATMLAPADPAAAQSLEEVELCIAGSGAQRYPGPYVVRFDVDSTDVKAEFMSQMEEAAKTIKGQKPTVVCLTGDTDKTGSVAYNEKLAVRRAHAVGNKLVEMGVNPTVLKVVTKTRTGEGKLTSKVIGEDRPAERRVTIRLAK